MAQEQEGYQGYQGYGQAMDPQTMRARLAMAMMQQGSDSSPIRSPWQGAARMSNSLFGALMMREMQAKQEANSQAIQNQFNAARTGGFGMGGAASAPGSADAGLPAQPGALADLANDPDIMRGVQNAAGNGLPDTATIGQSLNAGSGPPPQLGPPMPAMAPNNAAGGMPPNSMTAQGPQAFLHNSVAGPGAPSQITPSGPAPGNGRGGPEGFNPEDMAMFQQDMQAVPGAPPGQQAASGNGGGGILDQLKANIARTESQGSGGYSAIGPQTQSGDRAFGKYQVMGANIPSWTQAALGQPMTPQEFLQNPQAQEAVVNHRLGGYLQSYGPEGAARAWFTGSPTGTGSDVNGMTGDRYAALATQGLGGGTPLNNVGERYAGPAPGSPPLSFGGGQTPPPGGAIGAIQGAAGPGSGLNGPPGGGQVPASMQPNMMVAGPGVPSGANPGGNIMSPQMLGQPGAPPGGPPPMPPPNQGGGNPLSALGNMFGMSNPSSPQGGNGPAPAGGGAQGGGQGIPGVDPQVLMRVAMDPYSSPAARNMAGQLLQYYMPHPAEWRTNPGTNDQQAYNPMTGQPIQGMFRPGPHETSVQDIGTDMMGVKHQGIFDKNTGKLIQVLDPNSPTGVAQSGQPSTMPNGMSGGQSAPNAAAQPQGAPKTWAPGQEIDPVVDQKLQGLATQYSGGNQQAAGEVYQYAKALLSGNQQFVSAGTVAKSPIVMAGETIARQLDPDGMPQTRFDTIKANADTSSPTSLGGQRMAAQTSVRHIGSLAEASDLLGQQGQVSSSEMGAEVQNWAQRNLGGASSKFTDASQAYNAALVPVLGEIDKLYKGGQATEGEIMEMKTNLAPTASPQARQAALTMLSGLLQDKVNVLQSTWHMGVGNSFPDLPIVDEKGQAGLDYIKKWGAGPLAPAAAAASGQGGMPPGGFAHQGTAGGPVIIRSDADYNMLPSGAKFIGPDGKTRAKP